MAPCSGIFPGKALSFTGLCQDSLPPLRAQIGQGQQGAKRCQPWDSPLWDSPVYMLYQIRAFLGPAMFMVPGTVVCVCPRGIEDVLTLIA